MDEWLPSTNLPSSSSEIYSLWDEKKIFLPFQKIFFSFVCLHFTRYFFFSHTLALLMSKQGFLSKNRFSEKENMKNTFADTTSRGDITFDDVKRSAIKLKAINTGKKNVFFFFSLRRRMKNVTFQEMIFRAEKYDFRFWEFAFYWAVKLEHRFIYLCRVDGFQSRQHLKKMTDFTMFEFIMKSIQEKWRLSTKTGFEIRCVFLTQFFWIFPFFS